MSDDSGNLFFFPKELWEACLTPARRAAILRYVPATVQIIAPAEVTDSSGSPTGVLMVHHLALTVEDRNLFLYLLENPEVLDAIAKENPDAPELA